MVSGVGEGSKCRVCGGGHGLKGPMFEVQARRKRVFEAPRAEAATW